MHAFSVCRLCLGRRSTLRLCMRKSEECQRIRGASVCVRAPFDDKNRREFFAYAFRFWWAIAKAGKHAIDSMRPIDTLFCIKLILSISNRDISLRTKTMRNKKNNEWNGGRRVHAKRTECDRKISFLFTPHTAQSIRYYYHADPSLGRIWRTNEKSEFKIEHRKMFSHVFGLQSVWPFCSIFEMTFFFFSLEKNSFVVPLADFR